MIKIIVLDAGDVLYTTSKKDLTKIIKKFLLKCQVKYTTRVNKEWEKLKPLVNRGKITLKEAQEKWLEKLGLNKKLQKEWKKYDLQFLKTRKIKKEVKRTLKVLRKKYKIVVLSDCPYTKKMIQVIFKNLGINKFFEEIFTSYDIGYIKPEKEAYLTVLKHFRIKPEEAIFVSDSEEEIDGAREIKMITVFLNKKRYDKAHFHIKSFSQILKVLKKLEVFNF